MWDVKFNVRIPEAEQIPFYLNYVGCKVFEKVNIKLLSITGFTLTMWDVKLKN